MPLVSSWGAHRGVGWRDGPDVAKSIPPGPGQLQVDSGLISVVSKAPQFPSRLEVPQNPGLPSISHVRFSLSFWGAWLTSVLESSASVCGRDLPYNYSVSSRPWNLPGCLPPMRPLPSTPQLPTSLQTLTSPSNLGT